MTKIRSNQVFALAALATWLLQSCGGRVLESDAAAGANSQLAGQQDGGTLSVGVGGANSQLAGQQDGGALGAGVGGALQVAKGGAGGSTDVAGTAGLCGQRQCDCVFGTQRACNGHPEDGIGACTAGTQQCVRFAGEQTAFGDCQGDIGPMTEGCGPQMPDTNCNGIPGDGDYQLQPGCTRVFNSGYGKLVNLFDAPHPGTIAVHLCGTKCKSFSYLAPNCDGNSVLSDAIQGYASATALPNYVLVSVPASSCTQSSTYANAGYDVQAPAFSFYALP